MNVSFSKPTQYVAVGLNLVYFINQKDQSVWEIDSNIGKPIQIGVSASAIGYDGKFIYVVNKDNHSLWRYDFNPNKWTHVGNQVALLTAGFGSVYVYNSQDQRVWKYHNKPFSWSAIGNNAANMSCAKGSGILDMISNQKGNRGTVWRVSTNDNPPVTKCINEDRTALAVFNDDLYPYVVTDTYDIYKFDTGRGRWFYVGNNAASLSTGKVGMLYVVSSQNAGTVLEVNTNINPAAAQCIYKETNARLVFSNNEQALMVDNNNAIWRYMGSPNNWQKID